MTGTNFRVGLGSKVESSHGLRIGSNVSIGPRCLISVSGEIGDFVLIGMGVQIVGRADHATDQVGVPMVRSTWIGDRAAGERDIVRIGADVWVGGGCVLLSGISIGEGAIVGAGSVVTRDVSAYSIVAGVPAREIGRRFASAEDERRHSESIHHLASRHV